MRYTDDELQSLGVVRTVARGRRQEETAAYIYKCATCGRPVTHLMLILSKPVYCNLCKADAKGKIKAARAEAERREKELADLNITNPDKLRRFQKAADIMRKVGGYDAAISRAEKAYEKFGSTPEAVAAIILIHAGYRVIAQQPIASYRVDLVLPDEKTVIEIDGSLYHRDANKRELRDISIRQNLGAEWDVIHVPAEDMVERPKYFERLIKSRLQKKIPTARIAQSLRVKAERSD